VLTLAKCCVQGVAFNAAAEWLFRTSNHTLIGVSNKRGSIELNPARRVLQGGDTVIVLCENQALAQAAIDKPYAAVAADQKLVPPQRAEPKPAPKTLEGKILSNRAVGDVRTLLKPIEL
jgi:serine/threonine protein phosphatase PrpC